MGCAGDARFRFDHVASLGLSSWSMHIGRMLIGYASGDHDLELQNASLKEAGCVRIFADRVSGPNDIRHQRTTMLDEAGDGDVIIVHQVKRLSQSTAILLDNLRIMKCKGARLRSLTEPWSEALSDDKTDVLELLSGIVEFERSFGCCTCDWREAAKAKGVRFGRPSKLSNDEIDLAKRLLSEGRSMSDLAKMFDCHRATLYRILSTRSE